MVDENLVDELADYKKWMLEQQLKGNTADTDPTTYLVEREKELALKRLSTGLDEIDRLYNLVTADKGKITEYNYGQVLDMLEDVARALRTK